MSKKKGVILLEVIIMLNMLLVLIIYSAKVIANNSSKFKYYGIKEDIVSIEEYENDFLAKVEDVINSNEEILNKFVLYKEDNTIEYKYENEGIYQLRLEINNGIILLKGPYKNRYEFEKQINTFFYYDNEFDEIKVMLMPGNYKIYYSP